MSIVLKENCWQWDSSKGSFFMKYYEDAYLAQKVKSIHHQLEKIQFPYHVPVEKNEDDHIVKQRWYEGRSANYRQLEDRKLTLQVLQTLHQTNKEIDWTQLNLLPYYGVKEKWNRRFERFVDNQSSLTELLGDSYKKIVKQAEWALTSIEATKYVHEPQTLLHGDVVHHNFMIGEEGIKLVDFDLAAVGQKTDEIILWLHRVLPNINYNLIELMNEHPPLQEVRHKLHYLLYPNEVMREALYYLKLSPRQQQACYPFIQSIVSECIVYDKKLKQAIETIQS
jgi:thiamine kinase-like enzyme